MSVPFVGPCCRWGSEVCPYLPAAWGREPQRPQAEGCAGVHTLSGCRQIAEKGRN